MSQTTTAQQQVPAAQAQGSYHFILTLQSSVPSGGFRVFTTSGTHVPAPGWTRADFYKAIVDAVVQQNPELARANTLFFDLQPNRI